MTSGGSLLRWFVEEFCRDRPVADAFRLLDREATAIPPGSEGLTLLPYVLGEKTPLFDPAARGVLSGFTLGHTRAHVYRAILEAVAFGLRHHLDVLRERGHAPRRALISDGGARSALWRQLIADVLGLPVTWCDHPSGGALGAALVAGVSVGAWGWAMANRVARPRGTATPDLATALAYDRAYAAYRALYPAVAPFFRMARDE